MPALTVRVRCQQHDRQSGPIQVLQERVAQAMQAPGDDDRVHLAGFDHLHQLIGRQALGDHHDVVRGIEGGPQTLFKLLVTQAKRKTQASGRMHAQIAGRSPVGDLGYVQDRYGSRARNLGPYEAAHHG